MSDNSERPPKRQDGGLKDDKQRVSVREPGLDNGHGGAVEGGWRLEEEGEDDLAEQVAYLACLSHAPDAHAEDASRPRRVLQRGVDNPNRIDGPGGRARVAGVGQGIGWLGAVGPAEHVPESIPAVAKGGEQRIARRPKTGDLAGGSCRVRPRVTPQ